MLISHRLLIERIEWLDNLLGDLWFFTVLFLLAYIPVAILVGAWHRKNQIKIDMDLSILNNPLNAMLFRILLDMQSGKASPEEVERVRSMLKSIEAKRDS